MLTLTLRAATRVPIDLSPVLPTELAARSLADIERLTVWHGNRQTPLAELFQVRGDAGDARIELVGDLQGVHRIGAKMSGGQIHVHGSAGRELGSQMAAGEITVAGHAGDFAAQAMQGGLLRVAGDVGDFAASSLPANSRGMTGGTLLIGGAAGRELGTRLRRGLIAVGGAVGPFAGFEMLAGTLLVFGRCQPNVGAGMKRGTIGLLGDQSPELLPTFRHACRFEPAVLGLLAARLKALSFAAATQRLTASCDLFNGDLLFGGRGEVLIRAA